MTTNAKVHTPGGSRRSERKRAAILTAAEALFVAGGYEPTSVDAIAARASVSKRTVYDHFGDKRALYLAVLQRVHDAVLAAVRAAIEKELTGRRDLHEELTAFALRVTTETFPSSDYVTFRRLTSQARSAPRLPEAVREEPERILEQRFAELAAAGEIHTADPYRAAQHFVALTFRLALDTLDDVPAAASRSAEIPTIVGDGVDAFLRAYG